MIVKKIFISFCLIIAMFFGNLNVLGKVPGSVSAASMKKIKKAYAKALLTGKIKYNEIEYDGSKAELFYALYDFNWDGVKDLIFLSGDAGGYLYGWTYKSGKVRVLFKEHELDISTGGIYLDKRHKCYWEDSDGDGVGVYKWKIKNRCLIRVISYRKDWGIGEKPITTKMAKGKTIKISVSNFDKIYKKVRDKPVLKFKKTTKNALISKWG